MKETWRHIEDIFPGDLIYFTEPKIYALLWRKHLPQPMYLVISRDEKEIEVWELDRNRKLTYSTETIQFAFLISRPEKQTPCGTGFFARVWQSLESWWHML